MSHLPVPPPGCGPTTVNVVMAAQLAAAATAVAVGLGHPLGVGAALVCLATSSCLRARRPIGGSGADQLGFIVLVVVGLVWAAGWTPTAEYLGDLFLAAQVALAYFTAGWPRPCRPRGARGGP